MKPKPLLTGLLLLVAVLINSCKKEYSCENCQGGNKPPVANAGQDQLLTLPVDSADLNGKGSKDPDGVIASYSWRLVAGNSTAIIASPDSSISSLKNLLAGIYAFELKVTDNEGLSATDTVVIQVNNTAQANQPPVAIAGNDIIYRLPTTAINVNGSQSYDPDGTIEAYSWKQIDGPKQTNIVSPKNVASEVNSLTGGHYTLELTVTDNEGLTSKDTVRIIEDQSPLCGTNRPHINAELIKIGELSEGREHIIAATALNKILFVGGYGVNDVSSFISKNIDIYDYSLNAWSKAELSITRINMGIIASGNKIFIAGGEADGQYFSRLDIYDALTNTWSVAELSEARSNVAAVALGDKIYFAGGNRLEGNNMVYLNKVDIYNTSTGTWTTSTLSQARSTIVATAINNQIYFAGGMTNGDIISDQIDIYDATMQTWTTSQLVEPKYFFAGIASKGNIYWAGGYMGGNFSTSGSSSTVEIKNGVTQSTVITCLSTTRSAASAVLYNDDIIFYTSYPDYNSTENTFDIYNTVTGNWSVGVLTYNTWDQPAIIAAGGQVYVAGGDSRPYNVVKEVYLLKY